MFLGGTWLIYERRKEKPIKIAGEKIFEKLQINRNVGID